MRKTILFSAIIFLSSFHAIGQGYNKLVDTNKVWHQLINIWTGSMTWDDQLWIYKIHDDTLNHGKNYKILWSKEDTGSTVWSKNSFIREDSTHKVFIKSALDTFPEKLYYDFGMNMGDSIEAVMFGSGTYFKLDSIVQVPFGSGHSNKYYLRNNSGYPDTWIEGMGSIEGLLFPYSFSYVGGGFQLLCFWENDTLKYIDDYFYDCYYGNGPYNGISDFPKSEITLFPNPATTSITLSIPPLLGDAEVCVFNSLGEQVLKTKVHKAESEVKVDVAKLPAGMYFVKMNNYSGKFVKQN